jgi:hypothetical protein
VATMVASAGDSGRWCCFAVHDELRLPRRQGDSWA